MAKPLPQRIDKGSTEIGTWSRVHDRGAPAELDKRWRHMNVEHAGRADGQNRPAESTARQWPKPLRETWLRTSATVRKRSGLSSVTIRLTRPSWHLKTLMPAERAWYCVSPSITEYPAAFSWSNTRTRLSPATVTLQSCMVSEM